jgi:hypothetical protein
VRRSRNPYSSQNFRPEYICFKFKNASARIGASYPLDAIKTKIQSYAATGETADKTNVLAIVKNVLETEGISGLYAGVSGVMAGSAIMKSMAFTSNHWALNELMSSHPHVGVCVPATWELCAAAAFAGNYLCCLNFHLCT